MLACAAGGPLAAPHKAALPLPVPRGSFVELGAYDGLSNSNTFMLERCFAWRGLLVARLLRHHEDAALCLVVLAEFDAAIDLADDRVVGLGGR